MGFTLGKLAAAAGVLSGAVNAQFPPTPTGVSVLESEIENGIRISYKEVHIPRPGIQITPKSDSRRTIFVKPQKAYAATPATFIFPPAPLPILVCGTRPTRSTHSFGSMNGGPGSSSMLGLLRENGPCFVHSDSNSTYLNKWSWNNEGAEPTTDAVDISLTLA
jgi:hypothetical protein